MKEISNHQAPKKNKNKYLLTNIINGIHNAYTNIPLIFV